MISYRFSALHYRSSCAGSYWVTILALLRVRKISLVQVWYDSTSVFFHGLLKESSGVFSPHLQVRNLSAWFTCGQDLNILWSRTWMLLGDGRRGTHIHVMYLSLIREVYFWRCRKTTVLFHIYSEFANCLSNDTRSNTIDIGSNKTGSTASVFL